MLWDVDHTLIRIEGVSREVYGEAFLAVTGRRLERLGSLAGRTDRAIMIEALRGNGVAPSAAVVTAFAGALAAGFAARGDELRTRGRVLAGARAALESLAGRPDVIQSVLTGNMRPIALCKLTAFDLHGFLDLEVGAYGSDNGDRPPLVRLARQRVAQKYGESLDAASTVIVGDTPHDVLAGRHGGARVVAVATGASDQETLRRAGAGLVLPDLADTGAVLRAVLRAAEDRGEPRDRDGAERGRRPGPDDHG